MGVLVVLRSTFDMTNVFNAVDPVWYISRFNTGMLSNIRSSGTYNKRGIPPPRACVRRPKQHRVEDSNIRW